MTALSDLEKSLGLKPMDIDIQVSMGSSRDFENELHQIANKPLKVYTKQEVYADTEEIFKQKATLPIGNYNGYDPFSTPSKFDPVSVGQHLGIGTAKAANLFNEITLMYKQTTNERAKAICNELLNGLYSNTLNRVQCNDLINELNNLARM